MVKEKPTKKKPKKNHEQNKHRVLLLGGERQRWGGISRINTAGLVQWGKFI